MPIAWGVGAAEPESIGLDGDRLQGHETGLGIRRAAGFVETEVPVLAETENHRVQAAGGFDALLVRQGGGQRQGWI